MKHIRIAAALAAAVLGASPALASDKTPCAAGMVCASDPQSVASALQALGYKAKLEKDTEGDPSVASAADGYEYDILFYGCESHAKCDSLQFRLTFKPYQNHSADLANEWNRTHRFLRANVRPDKRLDFNYDVATIGGLNKANFEDVIAWWSTLLGDVDKFFREHPPGDPVTTPAGKSTATGPTAA